MTGRRDFRRLISPHPLIFIQNILVIIYFYQSHRNAILNRAKVGHISMCFYQYVYSVMQVCCSHLPGYVCYTVLSKPRVDERPTLDSVLRSIQVPRLTSSGEHCRCPLPDIANQIVQTFYMKNTNQWP